MKIYYTNFHRAWGGQPLQVLQLARSMRARGHEVTVFAPPESDLAVRAASAGVAVDTRCCFPRGFRPLPLLSDFHALRQRLSEDAPEILHCHGSQDSWIAASALLGFSAVTRLVRTRHNSYPVRRHAANRWLFARMIRHVIAVAEPIRDDLLRDGFLSPDRVSVIPAGLDDDFPKQAARSRLDVREEFHIPADAPLVGLVGRLAPDKGQDTLLRAVARLRETEPRLRVLLVGTGGDWDRIRSLLHELRLGEVVTWTGFRDDVASITAALDLSVLAARACDASSTVVKEAMALGIPVVAADVGGTAGILDNGRAGRLVPPGDEAALAGAILDVLRHPDDACARAAHAREHVRRYMASRIAEETEALYRRLIETPEGGGGA